MPQKGQITGTYKNIKPGDKIIARRPGYYDGGKCEYIGCSDCYDGWLTVISAYQRGVKTKECGFVGQNRIISLKRKDDERTDNKA